LVSGLLTPLLLKEGQGVVVCLPSSVLLWLPDRDAVKTAFPSDTWKRLEPPLTPPLKGGGLVSGLLTPLLTKEGLGVVKSCYPLQYENIAGDFYLR